MGFQAVQLVLFIDGEASALEHQLEHTSPVAPFWTVPIRSEASRQALLPHHRRPSADRAARKK